MQLYFHTHEGIDGTKFWMLHTGKKILIKYIRTRQKALDLCERLYKVRPTSGKVNTES